ncbi:hypothetical protein D3C81_1850390 [compost metagenome]
MPLTTAKAYKYSMWKPVPKKALAIITKAAALTTFAQSRIVFRFHLSTNVPANADIRNPAITLRESISPTVVIEPVRSIRYQLAPIVLMPTPKPDMMSAIK